MNDDITEAEREIRRAIGRMGYDIERVAVDRNYEDEWVVELEVNVHPDGHKVDEPLK